jgi:hypothetical protein
MANQQKNKIMKKHIIITILFFLAVGNYAQKNNTIKITDATINNTIEPRIFSIEGPMYIVNSNYVIYQEYGKTNLVDMDVKSFTYPKYDHTQLFALDKNAIYFRGKKVKNDTTGFKILANKPNPVNQFTLDVYWKTKDQLFKNTEEIIGDYDIPTLMPVSYQNDPYFKDKNFIYYNFKKIEGSDAASASETFGNRIYDKNFVYINGEIEKHKGENLQPVNHIFMKTSKMVIAYNLVEHPEIDPKTLIGLSKNYAMDKNHVYFQLEKTPIIPRNPSKIKVWDQINSRYVTDGTTIYMSANYLVSGYDAKTFGLLPNSDFWFDKNGVYQHKYDDKTEKAYDFKFPFKNVKNLSLADLKNGNNRYVIYKNQVYDPWDNKYYGNLSQEHINLVNDKKVDLADLKNGIITNKKVYDYLLYEANGKIYVNDTLTEADASTFERISYYYKDKNNVYQYNRGQNLIKIEGIDVNTINHFNIFTTDKDYAYIGNKRIIKNDKLEILAVFTGYRKGCGIDKTPSSDYYLLKNAEGYWLLLVSDKIEIRNLGNKLEGNLKTYELN